MAPTKGSSELKTIREAQRAAQSLAQLETDLRDRHTEVSKERKRTAKLLPPRAEALQNAERLTKDHAARHAKDHASLITLAVSGHYDTSAGADSKLVWRRPHLPAIHGMPLTFEDLAAWAPDAVAAHICDAIRCMPDDAFGLPSAERAARLAELDAEIAELERQHSEIVDAAAEVGIPLPLLAPVADRRAEVARETERTRLLSEARSGQQV